MGADHAHKEAASGLFDHFKLLKGSSLSTAWNYPVTTSVVCAIVKHKYFAHTSGAHINFRAMHNAQKIYIISAESQATASSICLEACRELMQVAENTSYCTENTNYMKS